MESDAELSPTTLVKESCSANTSSTKHFREQKPEDEDRLEIVAQVEYKDEAMTQSTVNATEREAADDAILLDWNITSFDIFINDELSVKMNQVPQSNETSQRLVKDDATTLHNNYHHLDQVTEETNSDEIEVGPSDEIIVKKQPVKSEDSIVATGPVSAAKCEVEMEQENSKGILQLRKNRIREFHIRQRNDRLKNIKSHSSGDEEKNPRPCNEETNRHLTSYYKQKEAKSGSTNKSSNIGINEQDTADSLAKMGSASVLSNNDDLAASIQPPAAVKTTPELHVEVDSTCQEEKYFPCSSPTSSSMASFGSPNHSSSKSLQPSPIPNYARFRFTSRVSYDRAHYNSVLTEDVKEEGKVEPAVLSGDCPIEEINGASNKKESVQNGKKAEVIDTVAEEFEMTTVMENEYLSESLTELRNNNNSFIEFKPEEAASEKKDTEVEELETSITATKTTTTKEIGKRPKWPPVTVTNVSSPLHIKVDSLCEEAYQFSPCSSNSLNSSPTRFSSLKPHSPIPKYTRLRTFSRMSYDRAYYSENLEDL